MQLLQKKIALLAKFLQIKLVTEQGQNYEIINLFYWTPHVEILNTVIDFSRIALFIFL